MRGKEKCRALKEIRKQIAQENDIEYAVSECSFQGECKGTCPKCEAELRYLERELERRKNLGKAVCVVGISTAVCSGLTACNPAESVRDVINDIFNIGVTEETAGVLPAPEQLTGDVEVVPETTEIQEDTIDGGIMPPEEIEAPEETIVPEEIEGKTVELPLQEVLEGDVAIVEGGIMVAPQNSATPIEEEVLAGDVPLAPEE